MRRAPLSPLLFLAVADAFGVRLSPCSRRQQGPIWRFHPQRRATAPHDHDRVQGAYTRRRRRSLCAMAMAIGAEMEGESRIRGDPGALRRWFRRFGGTLRHVALAETPGKGWGLRAEQDLEVGETLAVIPRSLCLGLAHEAAEGEGEIGGRIDDAWTGPPCVQALVGQVPEEFADVRLGLVLLHERFKEGSKWGPYVGNLPRAFKGVPLSSFAAVEMRALQDRELAAEIDERCKFLVTFINDVLDALGTGPEAPFGEHRVTFGDLVWATAAVSSRAYTHLYGGWRQESRPLLVPFMDMLNFNMRESNVQVLSAWPSNGEEEDGGDGSPERPEVRLVTTRPVAAGESLEIRENYGNADLLCKYGFVDLDRRSERNAFTFEKKILRAARMVAGILDEPFGARFETDALEPWQRRALCDLRLDGPEADLTVHLGGDSTRGRLPVDERLLAALRVMFARDKKGLEGKTAKQLGRYKTGRLSDYVEQRVLATVLGLSLIYVQQWPTTLEQDENIMYGRRVSPTLDEALSLPPPWQILAEEDVTLQDMIIQDLVAGEMARSENTEDYDDRDERNDREADEHAGAEGESQMPHNHVEVESQNEHVGKHEEGEGEQGDEEGGAGEDGGDAEEEAGSVPDVKPELSWEMTQAMAYRLSKKRTIRDVGLLARAELKKLGPAEGMMDDARLSVGPLSEWISDRSVARPRSDGIDPVADQ